MSNPAKTGKQKPLNTPVAGIANRSANRNDGTFVDIIKQIHSATQQLHLHFNEINSFESMKQEMNTLNAQLSEKEEEQKELQKKLEAAEYENKVLTNRFGDMAAQWSREKEQQATTFQSYKDMHQRSASKDIQTLRKKLTAAEESEQEKDKYLQAAKEDIKVYQQRFNNCHAELYKLRNTIGFIRSGKALTELFTDLATELHELATKHFSFPISSPLYKPDEVFDQLHRSGFLKMIDRAIPVSNTPESCMLRVAGVEATIAACLTEQMFHLVFPGSNFENASFKLIGSILDELQSTDPKKEAIFRTILASSELRNINTQQDLIINKIKDNVTNKCRPMLELTPGGMEEFKNDLGGFLRNALNIWKDAQKREARVIATMDVKEEEWGEQEQHVQLENSADKQETLHGVEPVVVLFPKIYQSSDKDPIAVHNGHALWSDREFYILGRREYETQRARLNSASGNYSGRRGVTQRRMSTKE